MKHHSYRFKRWSCELPDLLLFLVVWIRSLERCCFIFFMMFKDFPDIVWERVSVVRLNDSVDYIGGIVCNLIHKASPTATALIMVF